MQNNTKLTVSITDTAEILGVSVPTVYKLIKRDDFPSFKVGRRTLISYVGLSEWIERQTAERGFDDG